MGSSDIPVGYSIFCLLHELIPIFCIRLDNYVAPNGNQYTDRDYPALEDAVSPQSKNKRKKREVVNEKQKKKRKKRKVVDEKQEKKRKKRKVVDEKQEKKRKKRKVVDEKQEKKRKKRKTLRKVVEDRIYI